MLLYLIPSIPILLQQEATKLESKPILFMAKLQILLERYAYSEIGGTFILI